MLLRRTEITGAVTEPRVMNLRVGIEPKTGPRDSQTLFMCVLNPIPDRDTVRANQETHNVIVDVKLLLCFKFVTI